MANRPTFIDVRSQSHNGVREGNGMASPRGGLPSPRLHLAGAVPPQLSPLDAFAAQSRMLAKQLDEGSNAAGRRLSRLPPLTIENTLQNRPGYFRSLSAEPASDSTSPRSAGVKMAIEEPELRPKSIYPQFSNERSSITPVPTPRLDTHDEEPFRGRRPPSPGAGPTAGPPFFGGRREQSPATMDRVPRNRNQAPAALQSRSSGESMRLKREGSGPRRPHDASLAAGGYDSRALAPPRSPYAQRTPSPKSMSESSDDDFASRAPTLGMHRNTSNASGLSASPTGISPGLDSKGRSPSVSSEISVGGTRLPKPSFNFSRPLSRVSLNGPSAPAPAPSPAPNPVQTFAATPAPVEIPTRQASSDSQPSFVLADDTAHTPVSLHGETFPDASGETGAAPSYVYSTFSLPRGKTLQRNSLIFQEQVQFPWEQPGFSDTLLAGAPPSPPSRPSTSSRHENTRPSLDPGRPPYTSKLSFEASRLSAEHDRSTPRPSVERPTSASAGSSTTIKARPHNSLLPAAEWSAEEHVAKAIEFHEAGAFTKSTYHLRLAARQHHPTGMLLYALACRHGWGMRPNQKEGVAWLRKAADAVSPEMFDEERPGDGGVEDLLERKQKKAQFALSIYELGVSHMNGWGIEQDKSLALKCFEIAGSWGDADALAEAGYCYAQGVGCKKDLKKSAGLYRQAEAKGISMVGNSWIYKSKYNDDAPKDSKKKSTDRGRSSTDREPKARSKSRTRSMFGRMKSHREPDYSSEPLP